MPDNDVQKAAEEWDLGGWKLSPQKIAIVYSYMKTKYESGATLQDMERVTGLSTDVLSMSLRTLEAYGYIMISRRSKPFLYSVVK